MSLELKIPPVIVLMSAMLVNYIASVFIPVGHLVLPFTIQIFGTFSLLGIIVAIVGVCSFRAHATSVNPLDPNKASSLVDSGVYSLTRNPMYVGMALISIGYAWYCSHASGLLVIFGFVAYMTFFQIIPEEKVLYSIFGQEYDDYFKRVRRWL